MAHLLFIECFFVIIFILLIIILSAPKHWFIQCFLKMYFGLHTGTKQGGQMSKAPASPSGRSENPKIAGSSPEPRVRNLIESNQRLKH